MASRSKRRAARNKRGRKSATTTVDPHAEVAVGAMLAMFDEIGAFAGAEDPVGEIAAALDSAVDHASEAIRPVDPARIIEAARLGGLPWGPMGSVAGNANYAPPQAELIALIALTTGRDTNVAGQQSSGSADPIATGGAQPATNLVNGQLLREIDQIMRLAQLREMAEADQADPLAHVTALMRGSEIWVRNTSYPDMLERTVLDLFADAKVRAVLRADLGFDASEALAVLHGCHELQVAKLNARMITMGDAVAEAMSGQPDEQTRATVSAAWTAAWEGSAAEVAISVGELSASTGLSADVVKAVLRYFTVNLGAATPREVATEYTRGNNPLRTHPVIEVGQHFMLVHDAHTIGAVRENFEQHLKGTTAWDIYAKQRGDLLEVRTREAMRIILPTATYHEGFEYFVPASATEEGQDPLKYTKKVEGDHLIVIDDVAFIIEDKAVAVTPSARTGETRRLRRDLTGIVTRAADQGARLRNRIVADRGLRIHASGWLDLSHIREIHTIAVSLDDLTGVSTATAEVVNAGILRADNIPWTVSIHDLDLIAHLVDHPGEFLLYLRRRRNAETTVMFTATDELDLYLYFLSAGLWVEPDPDALRTAFPFLQPATTAERRRYRQQKPALITSHTDDLDAWYYGVAAAEKSIDAGLDVKPESIPPKPSFPTTPLRQLVNDLKDNSSYGWLSTSATLLAGAAAAQEKFARIPIDLVQNPFADGRMRSQTVPIPAPTADEGWLLVWMTMPAEADRQAFEKTARDYLRAKKHQLGIPRGAVLIYSQVTGRFVDSLFDDHIGPLDPALVELSKTLKPPEDLTGQVHPRGKIRSGTKRKTRRRKR